VREDESLMKALTAARYGLERRENAPFIGESGAGYLGMSHEQNLNAWFDEKGITVRPTVSESEQANLWRMGMRLKAYGYGERLEDAPPVLVQKVKENRIEYERAYAQPAMPESGFAIPDLKAQIKDSMLRGARPRVVEWYENKSEGIEQGFTLDARPAGGTNAGVDERLRLVVSVMGDLHARVKDEGQAVELLNAKGDAVLSYSKLAVLDAGGKQLAARMSVSEAGDEIALEVDDMDASYPITIDPQISAGLWEERARLMAKE
jgi:hypothetical protein